MRRRLMSKQGGVKAALIQQLDTQAGDVVFASPNSEEKRFYRLGDGNDVIPSEYVPIGVVVIPASHNVYGDFACGVMSLMLMDGGSPETGSIEGNLLYEWSADSQQVFNYFCYVGRNGSFTKNVKGVKDVLSGNNIQLPSDLFTKLQNTYDSKTFYDDTSYSYYAPSPYNNDGSRNEAYYQISSPSSSGNALSDFDGIGNTKKLIEGVDNTMFASVSCSKYFTVGTKSGDWYLPAIGEFGYFVARFKAISSAIQELRKIYGDNIASYLICESEMEYWTSTKFTDGLYTFFVDSGSPTTWGDYYEWYSCAIAFTKLGALERNYGDILISGGNTTDIPASGGSSQVTGYTYSQTYGYGDSTTNGGVITSGATIEATTVSANSLGTTVKDRAKVGSSVLTISMNGKTATAKYDVYQSANKQTLDSIDAYANYSSNPPSAIPQNDWLNAGGGYIDGKCIANYSYTSGSTDQADVTSSTTWTSQGNYGSISGNRFTVGSRGTTTGNDRYNYIYASFGGKTDSFNTGNYRNERWTTGTSGGAYSYGNVKAGTITNATIGAGGGSATAKAGNGSQTWSRTAITTYYEYTSGSTSSAVTTAASSGTNSVSPSSSSYTVSANSKGTTVSGATTVGSKLVTWSGSGGKSASGTMYVRQAANKREKIRVAIKSNKHSVVCDTVQSSDSSYVWTFEDWYNRYWYSPCSINTIFTVTNPRYTNGGYIYSSGSSSEEDIPVTLTAGDNCTLVETNKSKYTTATTSKYISAFSFSISGVGKNGLGASESGGFISVKVN